MRRLLYTTLLLLPLSAALHAEECPTLAVEGGWIRSAPPSAPVMAGYGRFSHDGAASVAIRAARSEAFGRIELHSMTMDEGVMRMRKLERMEVPAAAELVLEPGGLHLMLFEPARALVEGEEVRIELDVCADARQVINLPVRAKSPAAAAEPEADAHHHHHHQH